MYSAMTPLFLCIGILLVAYPDAARWLATFFAVIWIWKLIR